MRITPGRFRLGTNPYDGSGGAVTWTADPFDPESDDYWTAHHHPDSDAFVVHNEQTGVDTLTLHADDTTHVRDLRVTGEVTHPLHLGGDATRVSGFDANDRHWVHAGTTRDEDRLLAYERRTTGDYAVFVNEGDETNRVLTQGDEGELDAGTLGGNDPSDVVYRDGRHALTGDLDAADNAVTFADGSVTTADGDVVVDATGGVRATGPDGVAVPNGTVTQQGNRVLDESDDLGVTVENTDGTAAVENADAILAGTDLHFSDDGDDTATLSYTGGTGPTSAAVGDHVTASGDGSKTTFALPHSMSVVPDAPAVVPASRPASTDFEVTDVTVDAITIEYPTAPPDGTDNLKWYVVTTASGLDATTVSDDGATVLPNPGDLNFGDGLAAGDDGDGTVTLTTDASVAHTGDAATITAPWLFENGVDVTADADLGFTNSSATVQFALAYDETNDQHVWADRANSATVATVDRSQVVDFTQTPTVNGTELGTGDGGGGGDTDVANVTASGDDSTTTFALSHGLGATPSGAFVQPTSKAAMSDFRVTNKTDSDVVIQYHSAPPTGSGNLTYDVITHA